MSTLFNNRRVRPKEKSRAITDPAPVSLKASFVSRHYIGSLSHHPG